MRRQWALWVALCSALALITIGCGGSSDDPAEDTTEGGEADGLPPGSEGEPDAGGEPDTGDPPDGEPTPDAGEGPDGEDPDAGEGDPTGAFEQVKAQPADEVLQMAGLRSVVHLARDDDGVPHILARNAHDAFFAQGYIHAKDRFVQMLLIRGTVGGTLSKLVGGLDPGAVKDDIFARTLGFRRVAQQTWDQTPDGPVREMVLAYVDGINHYIDRLRADQESVPAAFGILVNKNLIDPWTPADVLTLAKYQIYNLGFDAISEINRTLQRVANAEFSPDSEDDRFARRAGIMADLSRFAPADPTYIVDGFTSHPWAGTALTANVPLTKVPWKAPDVALLQRAADGLSYPKSAFATFRGPPQGASNSWVVSGSLTDTGRAMLANDPHLNTTSPPLFHASHLVIEPEGDDPAMNIIGLQFPGLPGVLLGHSDRVAWGLTTAGHDFTDAFLETLVWKDGETWPRVLHNGEEVELEIATEVIEVGVSGAVTNTIEIQVPIVPHRGPLAPNIQNDALVLPTPGDDNAISMGWLGFFPSRELDAIYGWWTAQNTKEAMEAMRSWGAASQHIVFIDLEGNIGYGVDGQIPARPAAARDWHPETNPDGHAPWWVLLGTGEHDWLPDPLPRDELPNAYNPARGYVVTANNDATGTTDDNDPLNDFRYIGYDYAIGFRGGRITRLIEERIAAGDKLSLADMGTIQSDYYSNAHARLRPFYVQAGEALLDAYDDPGAYPDLAPLVEQNPDAAPRVAEALELLQGWSLWAETGTWGAPTAAQILDANATALANFWTVAALKGAFADERQHYQGVNDARAVKGMLWILEHPTESATYDPSTGQSALWDDMNTADVDESRDFVLARALLEALAELEKRWSADPATWLWGELHTKRFASMVPLGAGATYTWPQPEEGWGAGYPRRGDTYNVDACHGGFSSFTNFSCGGVALQRLLVEVTPDGFRSYNALPGGQVWNKDSKFYRNQLPTWLDNERRENWFTEAQLVPHLDSHWILQPGQ